MPEVDNTLHKIMSFIDDHSGEISEGDYLDMCNKLRDVYRVEDRLPIRVRTLPLSLQTNPIDSIYEKALQLGALGGKLTGAGGGGHLLLYCEPSKQQSILSEMKTRGLKHIPFSFHSEGCKILNLYDYGKPT